MKQINLSNKLFFIFIIGFLFSFLIFLLPFVLSQTYSLRVTNEHPFLVNGKWISANELKVGDKLTTVDGKRAKITGIKDVISEERFNVYNLEANPFSDFVVAGGVVVHNSNKDIPYRPTSEVMSPEFDSQRIAYARESLARGDPNFKLTAEQEQAIWDAHNSRYLRQKKLILEKVFDKCQTKELLDRGITGLEDLRIKPALNTIKDILKSAGIKEKDIDLEYFQLELEKIIADIESGKIKESQTVTSDYSNALNGERISDIRYKVETNGDGKFTINIERNGLEWMFNRDLQSFFDKLTFEQQKEFYGLRNKLNKGQIEGEQVLGSPDGNEYVGVDLSEGSKLLLKKNSDGSFQIMGVCKKNIKQTKLFNIKCAPEKVKSSIQTFIERIRGNPGGSALKDAEAFINEALPKLRNGEKFRNAHTVPDNGVPYTILDANELNIGGVGGRGNWRYAFSKNSDGSFSYVGIAEHLDSGGYKFYFNR